MMDLTSRTLLARALAACALAVSLASCGGGGGASNCTSIDPTRSDGLPNCSGGSTSGGATSGTLTLALQDSAGAPVNSITADRSGVIVATVKDSKGNALPNVAVTVTSNDAAAVFVPATGSALSDSKGVATIGLNSSGPTGAYVASVAAVQGTLSLKSTLNYGVVAAPGTAANQISFISALPQNIALKGTGGAGRQESSIVTFRVLDRLGKPVAGANVGFTLSGAVGTSGTGATTLSAASAVSSGDGSVTTTVLAGSVNTPVRVVATLVGTSPLVTALSDQLVVSTGIPDQDSISLSTEIYNVEGMNYDGCTSPIGSKVRVSLSDHFNNPVPDGTAVSFTAEGATIGASCLTGLVNTQLTNGDIITQKGTPGECSVSFCASEPRPVDGRITIMAYALGEESFVDNPALTNGVNRYDPGETFEDLCEPSRIDSAITNTQSNANIKDSKIFPCTAPTIGEAYIDSNGDGKFNTTGDGIYNGVLNIDPATGQTAANSIKSIVHVRRSLVQVLSGSVAKATLSDGTPLPAAIVLAKCVDGTAFANNPVTTRISIRDTNGTFFGGNILPGNILPAGTTITISTTNGRLVSDSSFTVPNTNDPSSSVWTYSVTLVSDASQSGGTATPPLACSDSTSSGGLKIKVVTPNGTETGFTVNVVEQ